MLCITCHKIQHIACISGLSNFVKRPTFYPIQIAFWTEPDLERPQDVQVAPESLDKFKTLLDQAGIEYDVAIEDLQR